MTDVENRIVLTDEEGKEHEFEVLDILEIDDNEYAILLPLEDNEDDEAIILRIGLDENGEEILYEIEDDDEWQMVAETWQKVITLEDNGEAR